MMPAWSPRYCEMRSPLIYLTHLGIYNSDHSNNLWRVPLRRILITTESSGASSLVLQYIIGEKICLLHPTQLNGTFPLVNLNI